MDKTINFKVDEKFYKEVKIRTINLGMTLKDYIIELIKKDLETKEK